MFSRIRNAIIRRLPSYKDEAEQLRDFVFNNIESISPDTAIVETGCGITTPVMAEIGNRSGATVYSCDNNDQKIRTLREKLGNEHENIEFLIGDSIASLNKICQRHERISLLFLDSAASALHTFREFCSVEDHLNDSALLLIDNAAIPGSTVKVESCQKGQDPCSIFDGFGRMGSDTIFPIRRLYGGSNKKSSR